MSGEILRAILDEKCSFSAPAFYGLTMPVSALATINGYLQCKGDRYFLMTGLAFFSVSGGQILYNNPSNGVYINVFDPNRQKTYFNNPLNMYSSFMNGTSTDFFTLPEYVLWQPNDLIGIALSGIATTQNYVTLAGIEYAK